LHGVQVREVEDANELEALGPAWREVLAQSETRSPFMTHAFVRHWWACFGSSQSLRVLVVEDSHGPCAIAPLAWAARVLGPFRYRSLELIGTGALWSAGTGLADRSDILSARRHEESLDAIVRAIWRMRDWDVLNLRGIPNDCTTARMLEERTQPGGGKLVREVRWRSPYLALPSHFDLYLAARSRNFRKTLRRKRLRLGAQGPVTFDLNAAAADPIGALSRAAFVCGRSWKGAYGTGLLLQPKIRRFLERLVTDPGAGAYLAEMRVGPSPVAYELGFCMDNKIWSYDGAYDRAWGHGSPGLLLTAEIIRNACSRGISEYDFMRGEEGYKMMWTAACRDEMEYVLDSGTMRGAIAREVVFRTRWRLRQSSRLVAAKTRITGAISSLVQRVRKKS
jgi:CelD/BcsL family acetyltransferase involved in cellulose biosynthesis